MTVEEFIEFCHPMHHERLRSFEGQMLFESMMIWLETPWHLVPQRKDHWQHFKFRLEEFLDECYNSDKPQGENK